MVAIRRAAAGLDMYRKVPADLLEGTRRGSILSYGAIVIMGLLFILETASYLSGNTLVTDVTLDSNTEQKVRINFNITMMDLRCDYAVVDVVSQLGTTQNVTSHISKFSLDAGGVKARYKGRNKLQNDILLSDSLVEDSLEELHENGEDAVSLDSTTFEFAKDENEYLFVDFYASWCSHCKTLAPTWEVLAEVMNDAATASLHEKMDAGQHDYSDQEYEDAKKAELPVFIAKVDCVDHKVLCMENQIWAYPTLRLFVDGEPYMNYQGDRTILNMVHWLTQHEELHKREVESRETHKVHRADEAARDILGVEETKEEMLKAPDMQRHLNTKPDHEKSPEQKEWAEKMQRHRNREKAFNENNWLEDDHPGCQISGFLWADRVPGNFHIQARSPSHDIAAHMTNVSHEVHHLSFGAPGVKYAIEKGTLDTPPKFEQTLNPLDGNVYINRNDHEAFHHYMKVITTNFDDPYNDKKNRRARAQDKSVVAYQILSSSQLSFYRNDVVPEAKFSYDPSPIAVHHRMEAKKHWYDYFTSLMAIIGGSFTVIGMLENSINAVVGGKKRR